MPTKGSNDGNNILYSDRNDNNRPICLLIAPRQKIYGPGKDKQDECLLTQEYLSNPLVEHMIEKISIIRQEFS